jgi:hypothetical protein
MRVHFDVVGFTEQPTWRSNRVTLDSVPRVGDIVEVPGLPAASPVSSMCVRPAHSHALKCLPFLRCASREVTR